MKFWIRFLAIFIVFSVSLSALFVLAQEKPQVLSPIAKIAPTPKPTLTPTPSPTPLPTSTPTPTLIPTPTPIPLTSTDLENLFTKYADIYNADKDLLRKIAACESGFNPNAASQDYLGLFQFSTNAWINSRKLMGENSDLSLRTNAEETVKTAAFKISRGELNAWPNCSK